MTTFPQSVMACTLSCSGGHTKTCAEENVRQKKKKWNPLLSSERQSDHHTPSRNAHAHVFRDCGARQVRAAARDRRLSLPCARRAVHCTSIRLQRCRPRKGGVECARHAVVSPLSVTDVSSN